MKMPVSKLVWLFSVNYDPTMLWPSFDLRHNGTLKSSRLSIRALEISSLITVFLSEQPHFYAALANKGPAFFPCLFTSFVTYFPPKLCSFQNGNEEKFAIFLHFLFFSFPFDAIVMTRWTQDSALSTSFLPPAQFVPPLPTFLRSLFFMLFGLWSQWI